MPMSIFNGKSRFALLLVGLVFLMTGCLGGLFSSKPTETTDPPTLLQGTLSGPSGLADGSVVAAAVDNPGFTDYLLDLASRFGGQSVFAAPAHIAGEGPLAHVTVAVYELVEFLNAPDRAQVL